MFENSYYEELLTTKGVEYFEKTKAAIFKNEQLF